MQQDTYIYSNVIKNKTNIYTENKNLKEKITF